MGRYFQRLPAEGFVVHPKELLYPLDVEFLRHAADRRLRNQRAYAKYMPTLYAQAGITLNQFVLKRKRRVGLLLRHKFMLVGKAHQIRENIGRLTGKVFGISIKDADCFGQLAKFFE
ncbi:MAG: hypothetical protein ACR2I2_13440 [Bryobacteraceae bacterium]